MKILKFILRIALPLALGILIFWWVYRKMDFAQLFEIMRQGVHYPWLILSVLIEVLSHVLRAVRWKMLIILLGIKPSLHTLTKAVFINYGANLILPRLGEFSRCAFLSQKEKISFSKVFGTLLSERLVDAIMVLLMVIIGIFTMRDIYDDFLENHVHIHIPLKTWLTSPYFYLIIIGLVTAVRFVNRKIKHPTLALKIKVIAHELLLGIKTLGVLPHKGQFFLWSVAIWGCYLLQLYICFFAFDFTKDLTINICLAMFVMGNIAFAIPVQGGIGPWHFMVISTMMFYGMEETLAAAFVLVVHTLITLVSASCGIYGIILSGNKRNQNKEIQPV